MSTPSFVSIFDAFDEIRGLRGLPLYAMLDYEDTGKITIEDMTYPGGDFDLRHICWSLANESPLEFQELWENIDILELYRMDATRSIAAFYRQQAAKRRNNK